MPTYKRVPGPAWVQLPLANLPILGTQFVWSAEMAFVSPYLLELGLTRAHMALVMLAAPFSGALADSSTSRWGRRRPFMLGGSVLCILSLMMLSYAKEISAWITGEDNHASSLGLTRAIAVVAVYCIDFTLNAATAAARALAIDVLPTELQSSSGAWASRMVGAGGIIGFYSGTAALPKLFPALGTSQIAIMSFLASIALLITQFFTSICVIESVHTSTAPRHSLKSHRRFWLFERFAAARRSLRSLPHEVKSVCAIQFFSWMGWFPAMFFGTVWIGDIYINEALRLGDPRSVTDPTLRAEGTRIGSRAMFYGALLTFVTSILLPYFVKNPDLRARGMESLSLGAEEGSGAVRSAPPPRGFKFTIGLSLCWQLAHITFGLLLLATGFVTSVRAATAIFALQGLCSATTHWVPFAIIATAAHKDAFKTMGPNEEYLAGNLPREQEYLLDSSASERYPPEFAGDAPNRAGLFLGIHNVFVVLPQFLSISLSAIIFSLRDPGRSVLGGAPTEFTSAQKLSSLTVILSIGGLNSLVAAFLTRKLLN
ncbi:MFS/sugar transport protein [Rhizoctonia solani]|uniref:MFS/sugar transport protein n=1 Tax=Rhizoctonia solani TaxID=456999 RepID=A0A8H8SUT3_9AGAM|nr:MFS/sugar transport protein [Rhizoctonia solani]QRW17727.1 MFS/sugar transport protein [Rhizoctonia solani]